MRSLERHRDVGAYALGVLGTADAFRFEEHLAQCPDCVRRIDELTPAADLLELYGRVTPAPVEPFARPDPGLLDRLVRAPRGQRRERARRGGLCAVAAAVALALAGPAAGILTPSGSGPARISARDGRTGVAATLTARDRTWGTEVRLTVTDSARRRICELVAVADDGSEEIVTTWHSPARSSTTRGGAALHRRDISRFEVRTEDGRRLLTLRA
ncbi:zf-HC2 domain-containing protein [Actinomycetota bacterium Odt1-20B]